MVAMKYSINTETCVEGMPVGRNCPLQPTDGELDAVWRVLRSTTKNLGKATTVIEVILVSFHQFLRLSDQVRYLEARFKVVLSYRDQKGEVRLDVEVETLLKQSLQSGKKLSGLIKDQIRAACSKLTEQSNELHTLITGD